MLKMTVRESLIQYQVSRRVFCRRVGEGRHITAHVFFKGTQGMRVNTWIGMRGHQRQRGAFLARRTLLLDFVDDVTEDHRQLGIQWKDEFETVEEGCWAAGRATRTSLCA